MALPLLLCLVLSFSVCISSHPFSRRSNGLRDCRKNMSIPALEVLPGGGWDNLRNLDMGRVMNFSYSQCQTTEDGVYFIPDEVFVIPQKVSGVETNSEIISTWLDHHSTTSHSINADGSFFSVLNAKYSTENQRMKSHQVRETAVTARVQVRNHLYTVKAYPDFTLDSRFAHQAEEIADAIENNQTRQAAYLSEKLVLDYGTHVITTIEAGASLVQDNTVSLPHRHISTLGQCPCASTSDAKGIPFASLFNAEGRPVDMNEDYLKASYVADSDTSRSTVTASAGFNFFNKVSFNIGSKDVHETSETRSYEGNVTYSLMMSHGGALFYPGITLQKWQESTLNNLVAIDRAGMPMHYFFTKAAFPDLAEPTIRKLAASVRRAVERYYTINTRPGCVAPDSKNFNFQANVDDGSCEGPATNLSFGGIYQHCTMLTADADSLCNAHAQKNPDTGDYTCREPFTPTLLQSQVVEEGYSRYECHRTCHRCWLVAKCCKDVCGDSYYVRRAKVDTYWCSTSKETKAYSGYLFGGLYSPSLQNPLTKSKSCPPNYIHLKLLTSGLMVCLSNDYETGTRFSVPFGGFFSCKSGNPLMGGQPRCPPKFSQHLAAISDGCQVLYCVQSGIFTGGELLPIHLPPFTRAPLISMVATNTVAIMTQGDKAWVRIGDTKMWKLAKADEIQNISQQLNDSEMSGGEKFGVTVGVLALVALIVVGVVVVVRRKRVRTKLLIGRGYEEISEGQAESERETQAEPQSEAGSDSPTQALLP